MDKFLTSLPHDFLPHFSYKKKTRQLQECFLISLINALTALFKTDRSDKKGLETRTSAIDNLLFCGQKKI